MTEREAWLKLAEWCDITWPGKSSCFGPWEQRPPGLCVAIEWWAADYFISYSTAYAMLGKIEPLPWWHDSAFKWPVTPEGHARRAAFCREQAALLEGATT